MSVGEWVIVIAALILFGWGGAIFFLDIFKDC